MLSAQAVPGHFLLITLSLHLVLGRQTISPQLKLLHCESLSQVTPEHLEYQLKAVDAQSSEELQDDLACE